MQFVIIGHDGTDKDAPARRQAVRPAHIALGEELREAGNMWYGAALYSEAGDMNGSMILVDFPSRTELQAWLDKEPYVTGSVWQKIEIYPCSVREPWQYNRPETFFKDK